MALTKLVNGERVPVPAAEETALLNEWAAYSPPVPESVREQIVKRLRGDPVLRALNNIERDRQGLTDTQMLDLLETKAQEAV